MYGFGKGGHQTPIVVCNLNGSLLPTSNVQDSDCDWMATRFTCTTGLTHATRFTRATHFAHATRFTHATRFECATLFTRAMRPLILNQKQKTILNDTQLKGGHSVDY